MRGLQFIDPLINYVNRRRSMTSEALAMWVEAVALVAIFGLDWLERRDQRRERGEQHKETAEQLDAAKRAAEAAGRSADAAKLSADVVAALHRPFIGLESHPLDSLASPRIWTVPIAMRNYGSLPAMSVRASFEFLTESAQESRFPLQEVAGPESAEIFPGSSYELNLRPLLPDQVQSKIATGSKRLILSVKARYDTPTGETVDYRAEAVLELVSKRFLVQKSETRTAYSTKIL